MSHLIRVDEEVHTYIVRCQGKLVEATVGQVRQDEALVFLLVLHRALGVWF